jgi:uncharacterized integral membrane protein
MTFSESCNGVAVTRRPSTDAVTSTAATVRCRMASGYVIVAVLAAAVAVFALQNRAPTSVRFFVWTLDGLPIAGVALASLVIGLVVAGLPLWIRGWRWRSRVRSAEARVAMLETALAERDQALLRRQQPPESPPSRPPTP